MELVTRVQQRARELGFARAEIVAVDRPTTADRLEQWLAEGRHGQMEYLTKWHDIRVGEQMLEPGHGTAVVVWTNYMQPLDRTSSGWRVARYALGDDYHEILRDRLRALGAFIHAETGAPISLRPAVDTAPVLERELAQRAGLGWIGKNTMLIDSDLGSFGFLGELYVDAALTPSDRPEHPDRCGTCTACIDACPTGAIVGPYVLDARRCISYLTIELRGPIPRGLRPLIGDHLFGCDVCQDVCPWNRAAPGSDDDAFRARPRYDLFSLTDLIRFPHAWYVEVFRGSAIKRAKYRGLLRNAAVVLGNRGQPEDVACLADALRNNEEPLVRGHVAWALGQIGTADAVDTLRAADVAEVSDYVRDEIADALQSSV